MLAYEIMTYRRHKHMKVFISWSGNKSQEVAKVLKHWIPCVIQSVEPYFSSADIDKGARWSTDIAKELQNASFGILCVTKENLSSAWLNFEAGALSKSIEQAKVCPFLVDLKPADIQDSPILQFQMTNATKDDVFRLFKSINTNLGDASLDENVLDTTFNTFWPKIEEDLQRVSSVPESTSSRRSSRDNQVAVEEILELVRYQHKLLKSPEELLPAKYLTDALRNVNGALSREIYVEMRDQLRSIILLSSSAIEESNSKDGASLPLAQLTEIQERAQKLDMFLRRRLRNVDFLY